MISSAVRPFFIFGWRRSLTGELEHRGYQQKRQAKKAEKIFVEG